MAEVVGSSVTETPESKTTTFTTPETLPIEERTDVTVDELEKMSLPYPAELYNGIDKVDAYLQQGTQLVWLVISKTCEVLVCTKEGKHSVRDVLTAPDLLPGFELHLSKIFVSLPQPKTPSDK